MSVGADYQRLDEPAQMDRVAGDLAAGKIVGWFDGRMEFGPRALGARSILGDPRNPRMQAQMNLKIKFREGFRPFAPSVLRERVADYFDLDADSPYMLLVAPVKPERCIPLTAAQHQLWGIDKLNVPRSDIPAVTHIDYSARVQTVTAESNRRYHALLTAFERHTGCAVLINTSFNVRGEPIVCSPEDAYQCFMRTDIDVLVLGLVRPRETTATRVEGDHSMATGVPARLTAQQGRRFGLTVGSAFLVFAAIAWWRGHPSTTAALGAVGGGLALAGLLIPTQLGPIERGWAKCKRMQPTSRNA